MLVRRAFCLSGLLVAGSVVGALATQFFLGWEPCVMCVEIRAWLLLAASLLLVASVLPDGILSRLIGVAGIFGAVGASVKGGQLFALEKGWVESFSCSPFAQFPKWLPLHEWAPYVFQPQAVCGEDIKSILFVPLSAWPLLMTLFIVALCGSAMLKTKK